MAKKYTTLSQAEIAAARAYGKITQAEIREAQELLTSLGYAPGPADGTEGKQTTAALNKFEKDQGITPTKKLILNRLGRLRAAVKKKEMQPLYQIATDERTADILSAVRGKPLAAKGFGRTEKERPKFTIRENSGPNAEFDYKQGRDTIVQGVGPYDTTDGKKEWRTGLTMSTTLHELRHRGVMMDPSILPESTTMSEGLTEEMTMRYLDLIDAHEEGNEQEVNEAKAYIDSIHRRLPGGKVRSLEALLTRAKGVRNRINQKITETSEEDVRKVRKGARRKGLANAAAAVAIGASAGTTDEEIFRNPWSSSPVYEEETVASAQNVWSSFPVYEELEDTEEQHLANLDVPDDDPDEPYRNPMTTKVGDFNEDQTAALMDVIGKRESSNNYKAENRFGYLGKYQFGAAALVDTGFIPMEKYRAWRKMPKGQRPSQKEFLADENNWSYTGGKQAWLADKGAQDEAIRDLLGENLKRLKSKRAIKKNTPPEDVAGYLMAAHLGGWSNAVKLAKGGEDFRDANNTSIKEYFDLGKNSLAVAETTPAAAPAAPAAPATPAPQQVAQAAAPEQPPLDFSFEGSKDLTKLDDGVYQDDAGDLFRVSSGSVKPYVA